MTVLARDAVASDHLVYAWPFPIGPECEVSCADDEQVVMCPAWMVGDRLGPGRHRWRTPDPSRPVGAYFVLTAPVEVSFDMVTSFIIPSTGMPVRLRASGSLQVRCSDPGLLIAQFVGLPFDHINEGVLRSVSRSVERMIARLLTRRAVMSGTPVAVTDPNMVPSIVEELIAYNPTAGAVFGVELIRMGYLVIVADDGTSPYLALPASNQGWPQPQPQAYANGYHRDSAPTAPPPIAQVMQPMQQPVQSGPQYARPVTPMTETIRSMAAVQPPDESPTDIDTPTLGRFNPHAPPTQASGEIVARHSTAPPTAVSGEIGGRPSSPVVPSSQPGPPLAAVSGEIGVRPSSPVITPQPGPSVIAVSGEIVARHSTVPPGASAAAPQPGPPAAVVSGEIVPRQSSVPPAEPLSAAAPQPGPPVAVVSGEIVPRKSSVPPVAAVAPEPALAPAPAPIAGTPPGPPVDAVSGEIKAARNAPTLPMAPLPKVTPPIGVDTAAAKPASVTPPPRPRQRPTLPPPLPSLPRKAPAEAVAAPPAGDTTRSDAPKVPPAVAAPSPTSVPAPVPAPAPAPAPVTAAAPSPAPAPKAQASSSSDTTAEPARGSVNSGMGATPASGVVGGEIPQKVAPGQRVLVPGPNGLMQSATVRQLLQGYYELEVGSSGQTIWVPIGGVVPEQL
ncbi:MAG: hypothetical protein SFX73_06305 [Kofleriaceae bacterium]|nr:hypothetical protein [Kofleriaceae bacterium]